MAEEFQNLNIVISGVEDTGPQIKLRDQNKRTYSFFKTKKDGGETVAFQNYQKFKIGDTVEISYKEVPYKDGIIRNIIGIRQATGAPESVPARSGGGRRAADRPGREYWEQREAKRQSSILMQVAFKAAIALEASRVRSGEAESRERIYSDTLEFYDWMDSQIVEEQQDSRSEQSRHPREEPGGEDEDLGF